MRVAFKKLTGPLINPTLPEGEQEAEQALFSGHRLSIVEERIAALSDAGDGAA